MLTRRRFMVASGVALCVPPMMSACSYQEALTVAIHRWIGYESLYLAEQFGWLPSDISLISNQNATESVSMLVEGRVKLACLTLDEVLLVLSASVPVKVGLIFNVSAGADMVISRYPINEVSTLTNIRLAYEPGALGALVLHHFVKAKGLSLQNIQLIDIPPDQQVTAWEQGDIDMAITYEPTASMLLARDGMRVFDSREMPERIFDVLAVRTDLLSRRDHRLMEAMLASHFKALEYIRTQRQDALYRIASRQQAEFSKVQRALGGVHLPTLESNQRYLSGLDARLMDAVTELEWLMLQSNIIEDAVTNPDMFDVRWLPRK